MKSRNLRVTVIALISLTLLFGAVFGLGVLNVAAEKAEDLYDSKTNRTLVDSDSDGFYDIGSADMLDTFSSLVNTNPSINGELTGNITYNTGDLSTLTGETSGKREFTPIGWLLITDGTKQHTYVNYTGHFNGNGYKISGLYFFYGMSYDAIGGLFASLGSGAKVYDLTVEKSYFAGVSYMGAIAGQMSAGSSIENCHNVGSYVGGSTRIGGIVGDISGSSSSVKYCSNSGKVAHFKVNDSIDRILECFGGIAGSVKYSATVSDSFNSGTVDATGAAIAGGIAGQTIDSGRVDRCMNSGDVICSDGDDVGGVVGFIYNTGISKCLNVGNVKGYGRVGHVYGSVNTPKSYSDLYYKDTVVVTREDVQKTWDAYSVEATETKLTSGELAHILGESFGQNIDNGKTNEGKPTYGGARVYYGYVSCDKDIGAIYSNTEVGNERPEHSYIFQASGATIGAYCQECEGTGGFTLLVDHAEREYNGLDPVVTVVGEIDGVEKPTVYTSVKGAPTLPKNVGEFVSKIEIKDVEASIEYKITPKKLTPILSGAVSKVYDGTTAVTEGTPIILLDDKVIGEDVTATATYEYDGANVGTTRVYATNITLTGNDAKNYVLTTTSVRGNIGTITKAESSVTAAPTANSLKYNGSDQALVTAGEAVGGTLKYSLDGVDWSETIPTGKEIDEYKVYYKVFGDGNHNDSDVDFVDVTIGKATASATLKPSPFILNYDGSEQVLANIGIANGGTIKYSLDGESFAEQMPKGKNAGTYKVYYKIFGDDNHFDSDVAFIEVTINKRIVTVTAEDKTAEQYLGFPKFTYRVEGFLPGEEGELSEAPTVGVSIKDTNAAGSFSITPSGGKVGENYQLAYSVGTLTVTPHTEHRAAAEVCDTRPICAICKAEFGEVVGHTDVDEDSICDVCSEELPNGLSGGAIAGIAVGGTATVGLGGFAIFWFVIKKKKFSDLLAVFKK